MFLNSVSYSIKSNYFLYFKIAAPVGPGCIYLLKHTVIVNLFLFIYIHFINVILYMDMTIV